MSKLRVFDFDETLVSTSSLVYLKRKGETITLTAEEFTYYKPQRGDKLDFSDFNNVVDPIDKKHQIVLKKILEKGTSDVIILTARHQDAKEAIRTWIITKFGCDLGITDIVCLGQSEPSAKAKWIKEYCELNNVDDLYFTDDSWENCKAVGDMMVDKLNRMKIQKV